MVISRLGSLNSVGLSSRSSDSLSAELFSVRVLKTALFVILAIWRPLLYFSIWLGWYLNPLEAELARSGAIVKPNVVDWRCYLSERRLLSMWSAAYTKRLDVPRVIWSSWLCIFLLRFASCCSLRACRRSWNSSSYTSYLEASLYLSFSIL